MLTTISISAQQVTLADAPYNDKMSLPHIYLTITHTDIHESHVRTCVETYDPPATARPAVKDSSFCCRRSAIRWDSALCAPTCHFDAASSMCVAHNGQSVHPCIRRVHPFTPVRTKFDTDPVGYLRAILFLSFLPFFILLSAHNVVDVVSRHKQSIIVSPK